MKRVSLPTSLASALVLVLLLALVGCGSDSGEAEPASAQAADGPPTDASVEDFCATFLDLLEHAAQTGGEMSGDDVIRVAKQTADTMAEIGTPADMPAEARQGFELAIERIGSLPDDAAREELEQIRDQLTEEQEQSFDALTSYVTNTCIALRSGLPSE